MNGVSPEKPGKIDSRYKQPLSFATIASFFLWAFCGLSLDMGQRETGCDIALIGFWAGVILILLRRPHSPTRVDLFYIRFAVIPLVFATVPTYLKDGGWLHRVVNQLTAR
jgi:hypothetical protein